MVAIPPETSAVNSILGESIPGTQTLTIDPDRETYYNELTEKLNERDVRELPLLASNWLRAIAPRQRPSSFNPEDLNPIEAINEHPALKQIRTTFGYHFERPMFQTTIPTVRKIREALTGTDAPSTAITLS